MAIVHDAVESFLAVGYSCEEVRQSLRSGSTEEGHLAYTSVPAQQSSDTITAAGPIPFLSLTSSSSYSTNAKSD